MRRRLSTLAALAACGIAFCSLAIDHPATADAHREGRVLASLFCETEYEDALRQAREFRGGERERFKEAAHKRLEACRKKARLAYQVEDVMPRLIPR